jgi:hypothetical protein
MYSVVTLGTCGPLAKDREGSSTHSFLRGSRVGHPFRRQPFPGLRYAPSEAIFTVSPREERQRVEVHRLPHLKIEMWATRLGHPTLTTFCLFWLKAKPLQLPKSQAKNRGCSLVFTHGRRCDARINKRLIYCGVCCEKPRAA